MSYKFKDKNNMQALPYSDYLFSIVCFLENIVINTLPKTPADNDAAKTAILPKERR